MLRRPLSLALRAALTFTCVYAVVIAVFIAVLAIDDARDDRNRYAGARTAIERAADDLVQTGTGLGMRRDGGFAALASRNPEIWLLVRSEGGSFFFGTVPEDVALAFRSQGLRIESGRFYVPGFEPPLANATFEWRKIGSDSVLLAVGGVDPATLAFTDRLGAFLGGGLFLWLARTAFIAFVATLIALPILARALRPLTVEAASILPQEPSRRLDERKAPRELLPLVRGFNAALDRLATELGRRKRFIADAAHELRTPLAVVALRVEALEDESQKQDLRRGIERLVHIVSQMLDVERLSLSGRERSPVDLSALSRDCVADLAPTAIQAGYDLSLVAPDAPVIVTGDPHGISRALTNLIGNAIAHGGGAGQIAVEVANRTIDVTDEGPGIPAGLQPRLFEPFSRGSQDAEGCGLGLHLTREIMRAHGGDVEPLPSKQGARFRLRFPPPTGEAAARRRGKR